MYTLEKIKNDIVKKINKALGDDLVQASDLVYPPAYTKASSGKAKSGMGDLSLPCFKIAKKLKKKPNELAMELEKKIGEAKAIGPYLNLTLNKKRLAKGVLGEAEKLKDGYGENKNLKGKKIMVEFAHPNPFKSFHIGHLRNILLGESIVRLLEASGAKVIRTNYQGDVGMHIAKCLWAFAKVKKSSYPKITDEKVALLGKCYKKGAAAFEDSKKIEKEITGINKKIYTGVDKNINKLWELGKKWSLEKFQEIYTRVYTTFDKEYMESEVMEDGMKQVEIAFKKGILKKSKGAIVFDGGQYGLDTRVFLNSKGLPTYEGKELGLAFREFEDFGKIDLCIHNVAVEQISFFKVTFKVEELLNKIKFAGKQYHNAYEFVGLKKGKMSSRKGEVILGNDILNEANNRILRKIKNRKEVKNKKEVAEVVGVGAIKYGFLKISPFKYLAFDMEESVNFSGDSGPYLQYTYARIRSIIRKSGAKATKWLPSHLVGDKENEIIMKLAKYPEVVEKAGTIYDPSEIAKYLFELAQLFNDYYHSVPVLKAEKDVRQARLELIRSVSQVLKNGLELLGIKVVESM
ncbi:MAG: arginine--tRNA ligase [Patescibacteria group bacterium]